MALIELDSHNGDDIGSSDRARRVSSWLDYAQELGYGCAEYAYSQKNYDPDPGDVH